MGYLGVEHDTPTRGGLILSTDTSLSASRPLINSLCGDVLEWWLGVKNERKIRISPWEASV